ncbi:Uncharacterised protein [Vibrio cholerae]|uniref:Uncharacterized protein n=1 Tax=Vibrio cholerae TaxID=666 RepID=A0A656AUV6_VIBCL|nr:Uncharacterised protein [Vibrio cholerae]CSA89537.1 Uncharacterised protein [Vibrio cholerae]CSD39422.1 Uncharacterised protein [Vibrio cholerae]CSH82153.1 Uncharacterised protein [Vibrio cholerae]CSI33919.1 Uncharacterised protein [Vibrio cholerae]
MATRTGVLNKDAIFGFNIAQIIDINTVIKLPISHLWIVIDIELFHHFARSKLLGEWAIDLLIDRLIARLR